MTETNIGLRTGENPEIGSNEMQARTLASKKHAGYVLKLLADRFGSKAQVMLNEKGDSDSIWIKFEAVGNKMNANSPEVSQAGHLARSSGGERSRPPFFISRQRSNYTIFFEYDISALNGGKLWWDESEGSPNMPLARVEILANNGVHQEITAQWDGTRVKELKNIVQVPDRGVTTETVTFYYPSPQRNDAHKFTVEHIAPDGSSVLKSFGIAKVAPDPSGGYIELTGSPAGKEAFYSMKSFWDKDGNFLADQRTKDYFIIRETASQSLPQEYWFMQAGDYPFLEAVPAEPSHEPEKLELRWKP